MDKKLTETRENLIPTKLTTTLYNTKSYNTIKHNIIGQPSYSSE